MRVGCGSGLPSLLFELGWTRSRRFRKYKQSPTINLRVNAKKQHVYRQIMHAGQVDTRPLLAQAHCLYENVARTTKF